MKTSYCLFAIALLVLPLASPAAAKQDLPAIQKLRTTYERALKKIERSTAQAIEAERKAFTEALVKLEKRMQDAGRLDPFLAVQKERRRFAQDHQLSDKHMQHNLAGLLEAQQSYLKKLEQIPARKAQKTLTLAKQFDTALSRLQSTFTRKGKIEEALAAKKERQELKQRGEVTAARFVWADYEAGRKTAPVVPAPDRRPYTRPSRTPKHVSRPASIVKGAKTVAASGRGKYKTIAAAIAAASSGDTIQIIESPHTENKITINKDLTITGRGADATIVQAARTPGTANARIFTVSGGVKVVLKDMTLRHGDCRGTEGGGAIGGNAWQKNKITIERCTVTANRATAHGGGVGVKGSDFTIIDCTFSGNASGSMGGGAWLANANVTVRNSTFSGNTCENGGGGLALFPGKGQKDIIYSCTFYGNATKGDESWCGGLMGEGSTHVRVYSSLFAKNTARGSATKNGAAMQYCDFSHCIYEGAVYGHTDLGDNKQTSDAKVLPLANNGGPTMTHALKPDSPAVDKGTNPLSLKWDQRGAPCLRAVKGTTDAGSYEMR